MKNKWPKIFRAPLSVLAVFCLCLNMPQGWTAPQTTAGNENISAAGIAEGVVFGGDHILTVTAGSDVGATGGLSFDTGAVVRGTVTFQGASTLSGSIGKAGAADLVNTVNVDGVNGTTVTVGGSGLVETSAIDFGGDGTFLIGVGGTIDNGNTLGGFTLINADTAGQGELAFAGNATIYTSIGATRKLRLITINAGTVTSNEAAAHNATTLGFAGDGTLNLTAANSNIAAEITTVTNGQGTLILGNGAHTVTGEVGSAAASLKQVQVGTGTSAFSGNLYANDLNFNANGTVTIAAAKNVSGTVTTDANGTGTITYAGSTAVGGAIGAALSALSAINIGGGTFTFGSNLFANTITVTSNATLLKMTADTVIAAATDFTFQDATTAGLDLGNHTMTLTGKIDLNDNNILKTQINSLTDFGHIVSSGNSTSNAATAVAVSVNSYVPTGSTFKILDGAGGGAIANPSTVTDNSLVTSFAGTGAAGDLTLTASTAELVTISERPAGNNPARALEADAVGGKMQSTYTAIATLGSGEEATRALEQLSPENSDAPVRATLKMIHNVDQVIFARLDSLRSPRGVATGDDGLAKSVWIKTIGGYGSQGALKGETGYAFAYGGVTLGTDAQVKDSVIVGGAFTYARSNVNYDASAFGNTAIDNYQSTFYGNYQSGNWYLNSLLTFGLNRYDGRRVIDIGSDTHRADYAHWGQQYTVYSEGGRDFRVHLMTVTPLASLNYTYLGLNGYAESGAGELDLRVDRQGYHSVESGLGLKMASDMKVGHVTLAPDVHGLWYWDMVGDRVDITSRFSGGSTSFNARGEVPAQHRYVLGSAINIPLKDNMDVSLGYDLELRNEFISHNGFAKMQYVF